MAYKLTYEWYVSWIGPGTGQVGLGDSIQGPNMGANSQVLNQFSKAGGQVITGSGTGGILQSADITTLVTAAQADMSAQLNAQPALGQMQGWASGGN